MAITHAREIEQSKIEKDRFVLIRTLKELSKLKQQNKAKLVNSCPVYCLQRSKIEDYLSPKPPSKSKCPVVASAMESVPSEFELLFDIVLKWMGVNINNRSRKNTEK